MAAHDGIPEHDGAEKSVWTFYDYRNERGVNQIEAWINGLQPNQRKQVHATLSAKIKLNRNKPVLGEPFIKPWQGEPGLFEIRVSTSNAVWRPLACYGPNESSEFTLLVGTQKKGRNRPRDSGLNPPGAVDTAKRRREDILADRRFVTETWLIKVAPK